jgi:hypothetical protein
MIGNKMKNLKMKLFGAFIIDMLIAYSFSFAMCYGIIYKYFPNISEDMKYFVLLHIFPFVSLVVNNLIFIWGPYDCRFRMGMISVKIQYKKCEKIKRKMFYSNLWNFLFITLIFRAGYLLLPVELFLVLTPFVICIFAWEVSPPDMIVGLREYERIELPLRKGD